LAVSHLAHEEDGAGRAQRDGVAGLALHRGAGLLLLLYQPPDKAEPTVISYALASVRGFSIFFNWNKTFPRGRGNISRWKKGKRKRGKCERKEEIKER
jgi:hypothetical protein